MTKNTANPKKKSSTPEAPKPVVKANPFKPDPVRSKCKIEGCEGDHYARGWCQAHYRRYKRFGHPLMGSQGRVKVDRHHD